MEKNFKNLIGGIKLDKHGSIIGAKAILHGFFGKMNTTQALVDVHSITDAMGVYVSLLVLSLTILFLLMQGFTLLEFPT